MSIADETITIARRQGSVASRFAAFVAAASSASAGGITVAEFGELLTALVRIGVETLDSVRGMSGEEKKNYVLEAVGSLFDAVAALAVPWAAYPIWVACRPALRRLAVAFASGMIEQTLQIVRNR